jgi:uncharacterized membrane protein
MQLQQEVAKLHEELALLKAIASNQFNELEALKNDANRIKSTDANNGVCNGGPKTSPVGD